MKKYLSAILLVGLFITSVSTASVDEESAAHALRGKYRLKVNSKHSILFVLRSSGKIKLIGGNQRYNYTNANITYNYSDSSYQMNGLPVAHIVVGHGSDEDTQDYHVLLTVQRDGDDFMPRFLGSFVTHNDGPGSVSYAGATSFKVQKYSKKTKRYHTLK